MIDGHEDHRPATGYVDRLDAPAILHGAKMVPLEPSGNDILGDGRLRFITSV